METISYVLFYQYDPINTIYLEISKENTRIMISMANMFTKTSKDVSQKKNRWREKWRDLWWRHRFIRSIGLDFFVISSIDDPKDRAAINY